MHRGVELWNLKKSFTLTRWEGFRRSVREIAAVEGISLEVPSGQSVAFIGPNGAGKSTTIKILTGILHPSGGDARVMGLIPWRERRHLAYHIGAVFGQRSQLWYHLPATDTFELLSRIYSLKRAEFLKTRDILIDRFALGPFLQTPVRKLSLGQRMRAEIAASLLHRPKILFLDEPTIGLDVVARQELRDLIREWNREEGMTVFLTSHDAGDIEHVAERIIVIDHGRVVVDDKVSALRRRYFDAPLEKVIARIYLSGAEKVFDMKNIGKYTWIGYTSARASLAYTGEVLARTAFMAVILYVFLRLWAAVYADTGEERLGGLSLPQMMWYLMITESFWMSSVRLSAEVDEDVRTGRLAVQLTKPMSYPCALLGKALGERVVRFGINVLVGSAVAMILVGSIRITIIGTLMFLLALPLAFILDALGAIVIGLLAFWLESTVGPALLYSKTTMLAGGALLPLDLYSPVLQTILYWLPFATMIYGPARLLVFPDAALLRHLLAVQAVALAVFILAVVAIQHAALRRIHSHGG